MLGDGICLSYNIDLLRIGLIADICEVCAKHDAVLPGLHAFEMMERIPAVYWLFNEFFFRSSVGDTVWKRNCNKDKDKCGSLGNVPEQAFAMILLKNNYFAWLLDAKEKYPNLLTDYDSPRKREGKKSATDIYLKKWNFNLEGPSTDMVGDILIFEGHEKYESVALTTKEAVDVARRRSGDCPRFSSYEEVLDNLEFEFGREDAEDVRVGRVEDTIQAEMLKKKERLKKKRAMVREMRPYTGSYSEEGEVNSVTGSVAEVKATKFKGWNAKVFDDMAVIVDKIQDEDRVDAFARFRKAYREMDRIRRTEEDSRPIVTKKRVVEEEVTGKVWAKRIIVPFVF